MLTKVLGDQPGTVEVRFELAWPDGATRAAVAGEFNGWSTTADPMWPGDDGVFRASVVLEMGRATASGTCSTASAGSTPGTPTSTR
jgi:hypothetical protein